MTPAQAGDAAVAAEVTVEPTLTDYVRSAVAAELTTLPTYLYPYWSIKPLSDGGSVAAQAARANLIAVIVEEMLHMGLASNLLNALGADALFTKSPYLPTFPGKLLRTIANPAGFGSDVDLLPMSTASIKMLLEIELPEFGNNLETLGKFYTDNVVQNLPEGPAAYGGGRQLAGWDNPGPGVLFSISSCADAKQAVAEILDQGEGLTAANHNDGDHELAHYWRFNEIQESIDNGTLDLEADVYPIVASPGQASASYTDEQQAANRLFNTTYSRMLDALEATLISETPDVYPVATGLMGQLAQQAAVLRELGPVPGSEFLAGPTFDYIAAGA